MPQENSQPTSIAVADIKDRIAKLKAQREEAIAQVNAISGALSMLEQLIAPPPPQPDQPPKK